MSKLGIKGNIVGEELMIYVLNHFLKENNLILDGSENYLMSNHAEMLNVEVILKNCYKNIKNEKEKK